MSSTTTEAGWLDILFDPRDVGEVWTEIFRRLGDLRAEHTEIGGLASRDGGA